MKNLFKKENICWMVSIIGIFIILYVLILLGIINNVYETALMTIGIHIILAISLNLIIGITGQFSLGHAGFMVIGAYSAGVLLKQFGGNLLSLFIGMAIGMILCAILAIIVGIPTLRLKGDYLAIATLGVGEIVRIIILNMSITNGAAGLVLGKVVDWKLIYLFVVLCTIVIMNFTRSSYGRACIAVREDEIAAEAMGINTTKYKILAFVLGAMIASIGGSLYAGAFYVIKPDMFTYMKSIDILVLVVFGGMGSFTGSFVSSIIIGLMNVILQKFTSVRMILYGLALVIIMIFRPSGLLNTSEFTFTKVLKNFEKRKGAKS